MKPLALPRALTLLACALTASSVLAQAAPEAAAGSIKQPAATAAESASSPASATST